MMLKFNCALHNVWRSELMLHFLFFSNSEREDRNQCKVVRGHKKSLPNLTDLYFFFFFLIWNDYNYNYLIFAILRCKVVLDEKIRINSLTQSAELTAERWSTELDYLNRDLQGYVKKQTFVHFFLMLYHN